VAASSVCWDGYAPTEKTEKLGAKGQKTTYKLDGQTSSTILLFRLVNSYKIASRIELKELLKACMEFFSKPYSEILLSIHALLSS
jgi:hypothetical protein